MLGQFCRVSIFSVKLLNDLLFCWEVETSVYIKYLENVSKINCSQLIYNSALSNESVLTSDMQRFIHYLLTLTIARATRLLPHAAACSVLQQLTADFCEQIVLHPTDHHTNNQEATINTAHTDWWEKRVYYIARSTGGEFERQWYGSIVFTIRKSICNRETW